MSLLLATAVLTGITTGLIYALVAVGLNLIHMSTKVVNFAQGEFLMLATVFGNLLFIEKTMSLAIGIPLILVSIAVIAIIEFKIAIEPFMSKPDSLGWFLTTLGFSMIAVNLVSITWGSYSKPFPYILGNDSLSLWGLSVAPQQLIIIISSLVVIAIVIFFITKRPWGIALQAIAQDKDAAMLRGINIKKAAFLTLATSGAITALTGILIGPLVFASAFVGFAFTLKGFIAATIGGFDSFKGALLGGLFLGLWENIGLLFVPIGLKDTVAYSLLILILLIKPQGLLGQKVERRV